MAQFTGIAGFEAELNAEIEKVRQQGVEQMKLAARVVQMELNARTPVWAGETIRNYAWGLNGAPAGGHRDPIGGPGYVAGVGWSQQRKGDPGDTNHMSLGGEPRREANEAAVRSEMEGVLSGVRDLGILTVTNFGEIWDLVDNGGAPSSDRARNPGGVSLLAEQSARVALPHFA